MLKMKKHKLNIFPEAKPEDYERLREDIRTNGYDRRQPIVIYQGSILDGWNRKRACNELDIDAPSIQFDGTDADAIAFVMRTNKRRNLNSGQWATVAVEAEEIMAAIASQAEAERREKIAASRKDETRQKIAPSEKDNGKTAHKAASLFNTNRTYVNQAAKIKERAPDVFEKVKAGRMTMQDAARAVRAIPTDPWSPDEKERKAAVLNGLTVVANAQRDKNLIQWAEQSLLSVRIDRGSEFGNPFVLDADGSRDAVCDAYRDHYLPYKPSIQKRLRDLDGKVLVCHCYPERCHGDELISALLQTTETA